MVFKNYPKFTDLWNNPKIFAQHFLGLLVLKSMLLVPNNISFYRLTKKINVVFKIVLLMLFFSTAIIYNALAQNKSKIITGTVRDQIEVLPGVIVTVKGKPNVSALTDKAGKYKITVASTDNVLVFNFLGFTAQEVSINDKTIIDVRLEQSNIILNEVAVVEIGYGQVKRADLTSAVGSVNMADLQKAPVRSFEEALAGRVAGVQVTGTDGQPGEGLNVVIRGNSSVNYSNSPLYVIDGFPIENPDNNAINPSDIESIDILKDASATAIYGSRGANGVVIINTKRGNIGQPTVEYNASYGLSRVTSQVDLMNPYQFLELQFAIDSNRTKNSYFTNGKTLESYKDVEGVDFQNFLFRDAAFYNHAISLKGGTNNTKYFFSGSLTGTDGVIINSDFNRKQGRLNIEQKINNKLKAFANINYADSYRNGTIPRDQTSSVSGNDARYNLLYNVWSYRPINGTGNLDDLTSDLIDDSDIGGNAGVRVNPILSAENESSKYYLTNLDINGFLEYSFSNDLKLKVTAGLSNAGSRNDRFFNSNTRSGSPLTTQGATNGVNGSRAIGETIVYSNENILTYRKRFNKNHDLMLVGVFSQNYRNDRSTFLSANLLPNESLGIDDLESGQVANRSLTNTQNALIGYAARANYNMYNKYLFNFNFRADGSSKFNDKYGYFPSASFAWRLSEEKFFKNIKQISSAKFRISYGVTGNNRIGDFDYLSRIGTNINRGFVGFGNELSTAFYQLTLGNEDLKWETTKSFDTGLEVSLFRNKINLEVDYYNKTTSDLLFLARIAPSSGFNTVTRNIGETNNSGFEFTVTTNNFKSKSFSWSSNFNIAFNRNKLVALSDPSQLSLVSIVGSFDQNFGTGSYIAKIGEPIAQMYGYVYEGNYQYTDFYQSPSGAYILKNDVIAPDGGLTSAFRNTVQPGDPKYKDVNGDGVVNDFDLTIIGNPNPDFVGGFSNNFTFKNFDLNVFLQFSYGNDVLNANRLQLERPSLYAYNQFASYADRWTPTNPSNYAPRVLAPGTNVFSSRVIEDGSFIRLKTVSFGYNLPTKFLKKFDIKSLRVFSSAQNLITLTNYSGPDPEANTKGFGLTPGFDFSAYPRSLTVTMGLNVSF